MNAEYVPEYATGEILVCYRPAIGASIELAETLGEALQYELVGPWEHGDGVFIYLTEEGQENEACDLFKSKDEFVEWAERRYLKLENRWKGLDGIIGDLSSLYNNCQLPPNEYKLRIDELINALLEEYMNS